MTTGYNIREGAQILSDRFATDSAEVRTAPLPLRTSEPWSELTLPSAEDPLFSNFLLACTIWTALIFVGAWAYFGAQWIGLL